MPSRRRHRQPTTTSGAPLGSGEPDGDPVSQFGRMLREASEREAAAAARSEQQRAEARARQRAHEAHADELRQARRDLDRAIEAVRRAKAERRGEVEADAAWRMAKARVIELETGAAPEWAAAPPSDDSGEVSDGD